jgi:peptidoglycan L-alanyl-D-glutamate endopeptidase CwlK
MINSRSLDDLHPYVAYLGKQLVLACQQSLDCDLLVTSTYRDHESQNALYAQGRTTPGNIVTNAKGGQSFHNYQCAFDVVPVRNGKAVWGTTGPDGVLWQNIGMLGESLGLEWAGRWVSFKELAHFQYTAGLKLADFQAGKRLDDVIEVHYE